MNMNVENMVAWTLSHYGTSTYAVDEMTALAKAAVAVPEGGLIVEIGVYSGCTASLLLQAARGRDISVLLCDTFQYMWDENSKSRLEHLLSLFPDVHIIDAMYRTSAEAEKMTGVAVDLLHIDGDHSEGGISEDCRLWLPKMRGGGVAVFHDYQWDGENKYTAELPDVRKVVDAATERWERVWQGGSNGVLVVRKPAPKARYTA